MACSRFMMIDAVMYGPIPSANSVKFPVFAPPVIMLMNPRIPLAPICSAT